MCVLEAKIVLRVLYRKGGTPKKGGTLASPQFAKWATINFEARCWLANTTSLDAQHSSFEAGDVMCCDNF